MNDEFYMNLALNEAWKFQFLTYPNPAVGCIVLDQNGKILSIAAHEQSGEAHAELNAIYKAFQALNPRINLPEDPHLAYEFLLSHHNNIFQNGSIYVSLEPCTHFGKTPPCANLIAKLGFKRVYISVLDENEIASGGAKFLQDRGVEVVCKVCEEQGRVLLKPFLKWQKKQPFKLFKLALSLNGSAFGKIVSNEQSRTYAHKIRSKIELLVVGGNTLRLDRPILDARLAHAKAPDLCILSKNPFESFDQNIPALSVPERKIYSQIPKNTCFMMYEGGANFLKEFAKEMDMFLIFSNSNLNEFENARCDLSLKPLYRGTFGNDSYGIFEQN